MLRSEADGLPSARSRHSAKRPFSPFTAQSAMPESGGTFREEGRSCNRADERHLDLDLDQLTFIVETLAAGRLSCELLRWV